MRIAVISDVHANLPALAAVLEAIDRRAVDHVVCLGDIVGYHGEPGACVTEVRARCRIVVAGNHDREATRAEPTPGTRNAARQVLAWTRTQLDPDATAWLEALPTHVVTDHLVAAHGAYLTEVYVSGYVTSTMLEENLRAIAARPGWPTIALCGHTHVPMMAWWDGTEVVERRADTPTPWPTGARTVLLNPGAVGQPRDGDPRAAFGVIDLDARAFAVHRVPYDIDRTCAALRAAGLPDELAARLREGR